MSWGWARIARGRRPSSCGYAVPNVPVIWASQPLPALAAPAMLEAGPGTGEVRPEAATGRDRCCVMRANVGDLLVVPGRERRTGLVIRVLGRDGTPPYVVKWQSDGHIAMVTPGQYARIIPASPAAPTGLPAERPG
jgi:hypothetical protein